MNARPVSAAFSQLEKLAVQLDFYGRSLDVGTLAWSKDERRAYFEYHRDFLDARLSLAPFKLPPADGAIAAPYTPLDGLHGLFNDSLPDGWGRLLLDRRLQKHNIDHRLLTPLDRLAFVGRRGMGALRYVPDKVFGKHTDSEIDLDWAAAQADRFQAEVDEADVDRLQDIQGGSAGARPKIMVGLNVDTGRVVADAGEDLPDGFEHWMVKFKSNADPREIGAEEYAYSIMAREAGLHLPATRLIKGDKDGYFAVRRFDRTPDGSTHIQTVSGLLEADHRAPQIDYETLLKVTRLLTRDERHVRQMFRRMAFNVLAHNRDDHSKNHAFLLAKDGNWHPTPAYDLTLSEGPGGEHSLAVNGEGRRPTHKDMLAVGKGASIPDGEIQEILDAVHAAIDRWPDLAASAGLSQKRTDGVDYLLNGRGKPAKEE
jgi:serine/threonine-protein kinase HipA